MANSFLIFIKLFLHVGNYIAYSYNGALSINKEHNGIILHWIELKHKLYPEIVIKNVNRA